VSSAPPSGINRRRAERVAMPPTGGVVSVVGARLLDVSPYGMRIESPLPMESEAVLQFRLVIAGEKADVEARVAACVLTPGDKKRFGVGLEFVRIDDGVQERLREVLAKAPGAF